ncbi:hypothetical protein [Maribacter luteus]|uniref:hypothetical protein n=1 Tax=Maribacter luteus TaxID=2594478 RepID=UPI0024925129|nr:hypothetical protein [Maribacter luteus]
MKAIIILVITIMVSTTNTSFGQENKELNTTGTATLYIFRTSDIGALINFKYYIDENYIGKFNYGKYMKLELEPGEHFIFAKAENITFIKANFEASKTYFLNSLPRMGGIKAAVKLAQVTLEDERWLKRIRKHLVTKELVTFTQEELEEGQKKSTEIIRRARKKYNRFMEKGMGIPTLNQPIPLSSITLH